MAASKLTEEQKIQIGGEIDNEGLGYCIMHYGSFEGDDEVLRVLISNAKTSMKALEDYLNENEILV